MDDLAKQIMTMKDAIAIIEGDEDYTAMSENDIASAKSVAAKYAAKWGAPYTTQTDTADAAYG